MGGGLGQEAPPVARVTADRPLVRAAGGVVLRYERSQEPEIVLVHRPRYDDWSLPKGKCESGEVDEACAVREVAEETGLVCRPARELSTVAYRDAKGRPKVVRYWMMEVIEGELALASPEEVDEAAWVRVSEAPGLLTYERDVSVLGEAVALVRSGE
jgi:8-oxo-dGTP diphosphatase